MARLPQTEAPMRLPARWVRGRRLAACVLLGLGLLGNMPANAAPADPVTVHVKVQAGDTLYRVAGKQLSNGVSLQQMAAGLYLANPNAFVRGNINRLKAGSVLAVPSTRELKLTSNAQARRVIERHSQDLDAARSRMTREAARLEAEQGVRLATGKVQGTVDDKKQAALAPPDRLKLRQSTGPGGGTKSSPQEGPLSEGTRRNEAKTRASELWLNIDELKRRPPGHGAVVPASSALPAPINPIVQAPSPPMPSFPWPPPRASAEASVPENWLPAGNQVVLGDVAGKLERALVAAQFRRWSYLSVPNGFALVTQMEQIQPDGHPSSEPARWSTAMPPINHLGFFDYVRALANALPGYYRVIVFVVTDQPRSRTEGPPSAATAEQWLATGLDRLPSEIARVPHGSQRRVAALVYEFRKPSDSVSAQFVPESQTQGNLHLQRAGIAEPLSRP